MLLLLLILSSIAEITYSIGRVQSTAVEGVLICGEEPARSVLVKLHEHNTFSPDELMDSGETDSHGMFKLNGSSEEILSIDPKLDIYHDCEDGIKPCQRRFTIFIPPDYISQGKEPLKTFSLGLLQLAGKFEGETRDCLHV
ncbi:unnamed protein product [Nippostrongylus brasiliensis]|uniref:Transthyretin-like family protein n=1 Tax=Nippostrongylus brasiliensis TaxID=27835 RepID=A0A0N4YR91_NIPBR|nr:unnamed protein product [Nippostrongylus brasiliensis]